MSESAPVNEMFLLKGFTQDNLRVQVIAHPVHGNQLLILVMNIHGDDTAHGNELLILNTCKIHCKVQLQVHGKASSGTSDTNLVWEVRECAVLVWLKWT